MRSRGSDHKTRRPFEGKLTAFLFSDVVLFFCNKTDFDEMEQLFSTEINPNLDESEIFSILNEFRDDFNQKHFVRNDEFKAAADGIQGEQRRIFIEFLERSCTAEFSGYL